MIYPSLDELVKHVDSRYTLVIAAAKRARRILEDENLEEENSTKAVSIALQEIGSGKINIESAKVGIK